MHLLSVEVGRVISFDITLVDLTATEEDLYMKIADSRENSTNKYQHVIRLSIPKNFEMCNIILLFFMCKKYAHLNAYYILYRFGL